MNHDQLGEFVKDHLLPRLTDLEEEVRILREVCWPVCQALRERNQLDDMKTKKEFSRMLGIEEVKKLMVLKAGISRNPVDYSSSTLLHEELAAISSTN